MTRRLAFASLGIALLAQTLGTRPAAADDFFVFAVKTSLPVNQVVNGGVVNRTLKEKDLVNLALGRPLATKLDKKREILAVAVPRFPEDFQDGKVIVFDPSQNGLAQVTTVVAEPTVIDREYAQLANGTQGHGTITGETVETTLGDPAKNALQPAIAWASGAGKEQNHKGAVKGIVAGRMSFTVTENGQTRTITGFVVKGKVKVAVKLIGMFSDGDTGTPGCGDGIVQPGLNEECEFNQQAACPGHCNACRCVVCGNNRIDPGEICDGTDLFVCGMDPFNGCKVNCSGCSRCGDGIVNPPVEECDWNAPNQCGGGTCHNDCTCG